MHQFLSWILITFLWLASVNGPSVATQSSVTTGTQTQLGSSPWVHSGPASVRLISERASLDSAHAILLGIQVKLQPGWWTYWRAPGQSGLPPQFDWTGSTNLRWAPELYWPKPVQKTLFGHSLRLYREEIVFPLKIVAADPNMDTRLNLSLTLGICKDVCVPIMADLVLDLPANQSTGSSATDTLIKTNADLINRFRAHVPNTDQQRAGFAIKSVQRVSAKKGPALSIVVHKPASGDPPVLLIETAPNTVPMMAELTSARVDQRGRLTYGLALDTQRLASEARKGQRIRITAFDGAASLEQVWVVGTQTSATGLTGRTQSKPAGADPLDMPWTPKE